MSLAIRLRNWFRTKSIGAKFLFITLPCIGITALAFLMVMVMIEHRELEQINREMAQVRTQQDAYLLSNSVWNIEEKTIRAILDSLVRDSRVHCVRLFGVLTEQDEFRAGECQDRKSLLRILTPVEYVHDDQIHRIGELEHWVDVSVGRQELWEDIAHLIVLVLLLALILTVCVGIALRRIVLLPLNRVMASIQAYQTHGLRTPVDWSQNDELGNLIREYNEGLVRQEQAEWNLQEQLRFQRALKNTLPTPFAFVDPEGRLIDANPAFYQQLLQDPDKPPPPIPEILGDLKWPEITQLAAGQTRLMEISLDSGDLAGHTYFLAASPYQNQDNERQGYVLVLQDISERKRAEIAMMEAKKQAEQALRDLQRAQQSLVQAEKLASLGRLVAGIAHEINTPVGTSLTVASTLAERIEALRQDFEQGRLRKSALEHFIQDAAEAGGILQRSLMAAAEQIQKFKQVAVDQASSQRREFDLKTTLEEILSTLRPRLRHSQHQVEVSIPEGVTLNSYPGPLGQVVTNCFNNALLHGFDGIEAGRVRIEALPPRDGQVSLTISDNGRGMSAENLRRVFDPFFTTRMGNGGTGLGMNLVYTIVTGLLGGEIRVDSQPGQGTQVRIDIPLIAPDESKSALDQSHVR